MVITKYETIKANLRRWNYLNLSHLECEKQLEVVKKLDLPIEVLEKALAQQKSESESILMTTMVDEFKINGNLGSLDIDGFTIDIERHISGKIIDQEKAFEYLTKNGYGPKILRTLEFEKGSDISDIIRSPSMSFV